MVCNWARRSWIGPFLLALAIFSGGSAMVAFAFDPDIMAGSGGGAIGTSPRSFTEILLANMGAALMLFSGALFAGVTTIFGLVALSFYIGSTMAVAVHHAGLGGVAGSVWTYILFEFLAMVISATAGLHPLYMSLLSTNVEGSRLSRYVGGLTTSLKLQAVAVGLLTLAAGIEAFVISSR